MKLNLRAPEFALEEIKNNRNDIIAKTKLSKQEFNQIRHDLAIAVEFIPLEQYKKFLKPAIKISPDPNDIDFFALALKLKLPLWSNDALLRNQSKVKILSTSDLIETPDFSEILFPN